MLRPEIRPHPLTGLPADRADGGPPAHLLGRTGAGPGVHVWHFATLLFVKIPRK